MGLCKLPFLKWEFSKQRLQFAQADLPPVPFHYLLSRPCWGQAGCQKKRKPSRNSNFWVWAAVFQSKLNKLRKTTEKWLFFNVFGQFREFFEVYSILTEKQRTKPKKLTSLKNFASFGTHIAPKLAIIVEQL